MDAWSLESVLLHDALQGMLMFTGKVHNLCHFGFRHLISVDAAFANPMSMHTQHYSMCGRDILPRYGIMDDECRLAWANIEGWMANAKSRPISAR
jgi:hypothetical protein